MEAVDSMESAVAVDSLEESFHEVDLSFQEEEVSTPPIPKTLLCSDCGGIFKTASGFARHMRKHSNKKPYQCKICDKSFNEKGHYEGHFNGHGSLKSFKCHGCGKSFQYKSSLLRHGSRVCGTTEGHPTYKCGICQAFFKRKDTLRGHMKGVHTNSDKYHCSVCNKGFKWRSGLARHRTTHI